LLRTKDGRSVTMNVNLRTALATLSIAALLGAAGCRRHHNNGATPIVPHTPNSADYASEIQPLAAATTLPALHWSNFSDYQPLVQKFYAERDFELAWTRDGKPTAQATAFIQAIQDSAKLGLNPEDYDASLWSNRVGQLNSKSPASIAQFDVAMTITVMRLVSDLRIGRINPSHFNFEIDPSSKKLDLPQFLTTKAVEGNDIPGLLTSLEPDSETYRQTKAALAHYLDLARQQQAAPSDPLPTVEKSLSPGQPYRAAAALWQRLQLEGDAPDPSADTSSQKSVILSEATKGSEAEGPASSSATERIPTTIYTKSLAAAVKHYQQRHGLTPDGKLGAATIKSINVPLSYRVTQLDNSLERWRWLPDPYLNPRLLVNLPEFLLRGYSDDHHLDFTMKVVDGKAKGGHGTPVFGHMMKYLIFRPYWNVPVSIVKKELVPHIIARPDYLEAKNYEVTDRHGKPKLDYTLHQLQHSMVLVRERPGPTNSLGLVKFMFPNQYDIYLHSTPEVYLFDRTRRDFSHGCIRVQKPMDLATWVLDGQLDSDRQPWDLDKVTDAMNNGKDNHQVNLKKQLPVVIFYLTAFPSEDGEIHFFDDIYGYDAQLQAALAKGQPYPKAPEPINPKTQPGDTV
jgi:murein L,D-transpeptidase YcbB/YkuD